mmetsp:Transcript_12389/g.19906  ORF Transcript_12389/g.19906 Transcript_12389/m.19906 type:complete len:310 (-) Transcript_12389:346-1275(-)
MAPGTARPLKSTAVSLALLLFTLYSVLINTSNRNTNSKLEVAFSKRGGVNGAPRCRIASRISTLPIHTTSPHRYHSRPSLRLFPVQAGDPIDKMRASSIRKELDDLGVTYTDCFDKQDLVKRLDEARNGRIDPKFKKKASSSSSAAASPSTSSSSSSSSPVETVVDVIEPEVIEPDYYKSGSSSSSSSSSSFGSSSSGFDQQTFTQESYSSSRRGERDARSSFDADDYVQTETKKSEWGSYPDSEDFFTRGRVGGSRFESPPINRGLESEEAMSFLETFYKEFPEVRKVVDFFENPWVVCCSNPLLMKH